MENNNMEEFFNAFFASVMKEAEEQAKTETYDKVAIEAKNIYDAYVRAGFNETQAFTLTMETLKMSVNIAAIQQTNKKD